MTSEMAIQENVSRIVYCMMFSILVQLSSFIEHFT